MSSVKKNFAYNIIYQIFTALMPLITAPYLARVIGVNGVGVYSYTFTVAEYFVFFSLLGVNNYGNRTIAALKTEERSRTFIDIYTVQVTVSIIVSLVYICYAFIFNEKYLLITKLQTLYVISAGVDVTWYFFGTEKFKLTTLRNVIVKMGALVFIFTFVKNEDDVWKYTLIMAMSYLISQLIMWRYIVREVMYVRPSLKNMQEHFKCMLVLFIPVIAITIYKMMDKIMLEILGSVDELAYYESAEKIVRAPALLVTALGTAMLPRMSKLSSFGKRAEMVEYFKLSCNFSGFMVFPMAFGLSAVAGILVPLYYGKAFAGTIPLLKLLCFSLLFTSWASIIRTQYLLPLKKDGEYIASVFIGAFVNLILNILMIPQLGGLGAVIATILAEAAVAIVQTWVIRKELNVFIFLKEYCMYFPAALIIYSSVYVINHFLPLTIWTLIILFIIGVIEYIAIFFLLGKITGNVLYRKINNGIRNKISNRVKWY